MPLVKLKNITKFFPPNILANDHINLEVNVGEIHAILGENGAGKSTLMKILYGMLQPDEGEIYIDGRKVTFRSPRDAMKYGIRMVHQHFMLIENHTVAENIALGMRTSIVNPLKEVKRRIREVSNSYGLKVDPDDYIWQLSAGEKQRVEILRALIDDVRILILDEPTSILTPNEVEKLFEVLRRIRDSGKTILFVTHKLKEVFQISDRVTVLRKGRVIATKETSKTCEEELARLMIGEIAVNGINSNKSNYSSNEVVLEVEDLHVLNDKGVTAVKGVNFKVRSGEIVGIAGVAGNGQRELVEAIVGLRRAVRGRIRILNRDVTKASVLDRLKLGLAHIPEDRIGAGVVPRLSIVDNILLTRYFEKTFTLNSIIINYGKIREATREVISRFNVKASDISMPASTLSGGNIQKLIVGRELSKNPKIIVAVHPTYGLDIAASSYIRRMIIDAGNKGAGVLLVSEDLDELIEICDRIMVMFEGRIVGEFSRESFEPHTIGLLMAGIGGG